jgi:rhodanese-related sulfurtransferase
MGYMTRRSFAAAVLTAGLVAGLAGCSGGSDSGNGSGGSELDPAAFAAKADTSGTVVIDVRTPSEFAAGHLPKATNIDVEAGDFAQRIASLDKGASYALYCRSGRRSGIALDQMTSAGFTKVVHLAGGISAWTAQGHQLVTG